MSPDMTRCPLGAESASFEDHGCRVFIMKNLSWPLLLSPGEGKAFLIALSAVEKYMTFSGGLPRKQAPGTWN